MFTLIIILGILVLAILLFKIVRIALIGGVILLIAFLLYTCGFKGSIPVPHKEIPVREGITL